MARVWVKPHTNRGHRVKGHWRITKGRPHAKSRGRSRSKTSMRRLQLGADISARQRERERASKRIAQQNLRMNRRGKSSFPGRTGRHTPKSAIGKGRKGQLVRKTGRTRVVGSGAISGSTVRMALRARRRRRTKAKYARRARRKR